MYLYTTKGLNRKWQNVRELYAYITNTRGSCAKQSNHIEIKWYNPYFYFILPKLNKYIQTRFDFYTKKYFHQKTKELLYFRCILSKLYFFITFRHDLTITVKISPKNANNNAFNFFFPNHHVPKKKEKYPKHYQTQLKRLCLFSLS